MATTCFCGCERRISAISVNKKLVNTRGAQVTCRLEWFYAQAPAMRDAVGGSKDWVDQGIQIRELLVGAVHGTVDARTINESAIRQWQAFGREMETHFAQGLARLGKESRESNLDGNPLLKSFLEDDPQLADFFNREFPDHNPRN